MYTMAIAVVVIEVCSIILGTSQLAADNGRLAFVAGTFANANDLAALLLMGVPFGSYIAVCYGNICTSFYAFFLPLLASLFVGFGALP